MIRLEYYLANAPKNVINSLFRKIRTGNGLVKNSEIIQIVLNWALDSRRVAAEFSALEPLQQELIYLIYANGPEGLNRRQLSRLFNEENTTDLLNALNKMRQAYLITRSKTEHGEYYLGFQEFAPQVEKLFAQGLFAPVKAKTTQHTYQHLFLNHLVIFCAWAHRNRVKIGTEGEIHRRYQQSFSQRLEYSRTFIGDHADDEVQFLLEAASALQLIGLREKEIHPGPQLLTFLESSRQQQFRMVFDWWLKTRGLEKTTVLPVLEALKEESDINFPSRLFRSLEKHPSGFQSPTEWIQLPAIIRDMWTIGLISLSGAPGNICGIQVNGPDLEVLLQAESGDSGDNQHPPWVTPGFEIILPDNPPATWIFILEYLGEGVNDDVVLRYQLSKQTVVEGLKTGLPFHLSPDVLLDWSSTIDNVHTALQEWRSVVESSTMGQTYFLKVEDQGKMQELLELPDFTDAIEETIPGWGFLFNENSLTQVQELISHFGLEPALPENRPAPLQPIRRSGITETSPRPLGSDFFDYDTDAEQSQGADMAYTKYSNQFQQLEYNQILQVIRYASVMDQDLEVMLQDNETRRFKDVFLDNHSDPAKLCGNDSEGSQSELIIPDINKIRIPQEN